MGGDSMGYAWANTIATGTAITASAAIEIKTNLSAELTARTTSYAWQYVTSITSGAFIYANHVKEFRTAADLASASTLSCSSDNAVKDTTVDATADATANSGQNSSVDGGDDSSVDSGDDSSANASKDTTVDSGNNNAVYSSKDGTINTIKNNYH
jgi:hypothetical protein